MTFKRSFQYGVWDCFVDANPKAELWCTSGKQCIYIKIDTSIVVPQFFFNESIFSVTLQITSVPVAIANADFFVCGPRSGCLPFMCLKNALCVIVN